MLTHSSVMQRSFRALSARLVSGLLPLLLVACGGVEPAGPSDVDVGGEEASLAQRRQGLTHCEGAFAPPGRTGFRHLGSRLIALGPAGHSLQDQVTVPGGTTQVEGKFAYGTLSKDLEDEQVQLFVHDCTAWRSLGSALTDRDGRARIRLTAGTVPGIYALRMVVRGDATQAAGYLFVPPAGARLTVFDIDGTLTTSDLELVKDVIADLFEPILRGTYTPVPHPYARELVEERVRLGSLPVFLTGRPYWLNRSSRDWLAGQRMPLGVLRTTDRNSDALPAGVAAYKAAFLRSLRAQGFSVQAAYGNASTDITAYEAAGLPKSDTFIIGHNGGKSGTRGACAGDPTCKTWEEEVRRLRALP
jgi:hypothetical protein